MQQAWRLISCSNKGVSREAMPFAVGVLTKILHRAAHSLSVRSPSPAKVYIEPGCITVSRVLVATRSGVHFLLH